MNDDPLARLREGLRAELQQVERRIRRHAFLDRLESGEVDRAVLRRFAGEQNAILESDRRSFDHLAERFPESPSGPFFRTLAAGEGEALAHLLVLAEALGLAQAELDAHEPEPGCQAYPSYVARLALGGGRADVAVAFLVNLDAWGANCTRMRDALFRSYGVPDDALGFFDFFASPPPGFADEALAVARQGIELGESVESARQAARLLQAYELAFWDSLEDGGAWRA